MAHPHKSLGDDVEQKASNELFGPERHQFTSILIFSIAIREGNLPVMERADAIIRKCYTIGVATEVVEDMGSRAKWFSGIDHPRFFPQSIEKYTKAVGVGQGLDLSEEE